MIGSTFLLTSLGWFMLVTFGLLALIVLIFGRDSSGFDGGVMVMAFMFFGLLSFVGGLFVFDPAEPNPYAFNIWAILLGISPLIVAVVAFLIFVWKQMEQDENERISRI